MKKKILTLIVCLTLLVTPLPVNAATIDFSELINILFNNEEITDIYYNNELIWTTFKEPFYVIQDGVLQADSYTLAEQQLGAGGHSWGEQAWGNYLVNISQDGYCACSVSFDTKGAPNIQIAGELGAGYFGTNYPHCYKIEVIVTGDNVEIAKYTYDTAAYSFGFSETINVRGYKNITVKPIVTCIAYPDQATAMIAKLTTVYCCK